MKRKLLWAGAICLATIVVLIIGLSIFVKSYLRSDKLRAIVVSRVEGLTGRIASIDRIEVSLFKGIVVDGIDLKERNGKQDFIKAKEFVLEYRLLPLLRKRLVIKKVELVSPFINLVREKDGRFNFSDMMEKAGKGSETAPESAGGGGIPLSVETDKISISDARIEFTDEEGVAPAMKIAANSDLRFSSERGQGGPELTGRVDIKELTMKGNGVEVKSSGLVSIKQDDVEFDISSVVDKDTVKLSGDVKDYMKNPVARLDVNAVRLDIEKLMAMTGGKKDSSVKREAAQGESLKGRVKEERKEAKPGRLTASGEIKIGEAKYQGYVFRNFAAGYNFSGGNIIVSPITADLSGEEGMVLEGSAKGNLRASIAGGESAGESLKSTLAGRFNADLTKCEMKESKIGGAIAAFTGISEIGSPKFDTVHFVFTIAKEKIALNGTMASSLITLNPSGTVGFNKAIDIVTDLKVAPSLAGRIVAGRITRYITDEKGWTVIPLRITGTTNKPSVGLNQAAVTRQIEKGAVQEIQKRLFKGILGK